jgi:hypothetical protein
MQPKILIICDENEQWQYSIIKKYLSAHGIFESYVASSLRIANDIFLIENIDLIVTNTTINGRITIDSILNKKLFYGIPILFYTFDYQEFEYHKNFDTFKHKKYSDIHFLSYELNKLHDNIVKFFYLKINKKAGDYFFLKSISGKTERVYFEEIIYFKTKVVGCKIFTKSNQYNSPKSIVGLTSIMGDSIVRISEQYAVNIHYINSYTDDYIQIEGNKIQIGNRSAVLHLEKRFRKTKYLRY